MAPEMRGCWKERAGGGAGAERPHSVQQARTGLEDWPAQTFLSFTPFAYLSLLIVTSHPLSFALLPFNFNVSYSLISLAYLLFIPLTPLCLFFTLYPLTIVM